MGICESCLKAQEDAETTPLLGSKSATTEADLAALVPVKEEVSGNTVMHATCAACMCMSSVLRESLHTSCGARIARPNHFSSSPALPPTLQETKDWHQMLIDDANALFISSNHRHQQRTNHTPDEMREQLAGAFVSPSAMQGGGDLNPIPPTRNNSDPQALVDLLAEPIFISDRLDTGSDEIAEIVSSHIRSDRHKRENHSVVAHLKPVAVPAGGN